MAGACKGAASIIHSKYHCASHRLNLCVAHSCRIASVMNMMDAITCLANFFNYSPQRQKALENHLREYPEALKLKLIPLCKTRWVERLDALDVTVDLMEGVVNTLACMAQHMDKERNRETTTQASTLLKRLNFEFLVNLIITQKVLSFTSGITTRLQMRGIDMADAHEDIHQVIHTLQHVRLSVDSYCHDWFEHALETAGKMDIEVKKPRICGRQCHRQNAVGDRTTTPGKMSTEAIAKDYFKINVAIPLLEDVIGGLQARFENGQVDAMKGIKLLPSTVITEPNWISSVKPFLELYTDDIPSRRTLDAELIPWTQQWTEEWSKQWKKLKEQHFLATGSDLKQTAVEMNRLKKGAVPCTVASALAVTKPDIYPNIYCLLNILAVLPVTTCEAERCISSLRRLKPYMRSTTGQDRLSGLALMHVHQHIQIDVDDIVTEFARLYPQRMKLENILKY